MKKNNYLKVLTWPILFGVGQILLLFVIGLLYYVYGGTGYFSSFISNNSYIVAIANLIIFLPFF